MNHTIYLAERDVVAAQKLHATPRPWMSATLFALVMAIITVVCAGHRQPLGAAIGAIMCVSGLLALVYAVIIPYRARRIYRQHEILRQVHHFHWDDQYIHIRCAHSHGRMRWADFKRVKENRDLLLLYRSGTQFNIFPKRCFPGPDSLDDFRSRLVSPGRGIARNSQSTIARSPT